MKNFSRASSRFLNSSKRWFSSQPNTDIFENFDSLLTKRRCQAERSIVVEVPSVNSLDHVLHSCCAIGQVSSLFHYTTFNKYVNKHKEMLLVEFSEPSSAREMMLYCPTSSSACLPVRSPFFQYHDPRKPPAPLRQSQSLSTDNLNRQEQVEKQKVFRENILSDKDLKQSIFSCNSISEQMQLFYDKNKLTELGSRLRFLTCRQVEVALAGPLPHLSALPFGSSVNGFGHCWSDLDMVMQLEHSELVNGRACPKWAESFVLQNASDTAFGQQRVSSTRFLELVADVLRSTSPGCTQIVKVLKARVPIVKYHQQLTGLDCDLSINNWSGLYMSELLYQYSALDARVAPLLFCLRLWAKEAQLTSQHPGRWITNFSITTLALYYLISLKILPPFELLKEHARPEDARVAENSLDCSYLRSLSRIAALYSPPKATRRLTLEDLLLGFFSFYDEFDFRKHGLTIICGKTFIKPDSSAMYIQNPLDGSLNVSRNVTLEEVERFSMAVTRALHSLHQDAPQMSPGWGLLSLWSSSDHRPLQAISLDWNLIFNNDVKKSPPHSAEHSSADINASPQNRAEVKPSDTLHRNVDVRREISTGKSVRLVSNSAPSVINPQSASRNSQSPVAEGKYFSGPKLSSASKNSNRKSSKSNEHKRSLKISMKSRK